MSSVIEFEREGSSRREIGSKRVSSNALHDGKYSTEFRN